MFAAVSKKRMIGEAYKILPGFQSLVHMAVVVARSPLVTLCSPRYHHCHRNKSETPHLSTTRASLRQRFLKVKSTLATTKDLLHASYEKVKSVL